MTSWRSRFDSRLAGIGLVLFFLGSALFIMGLIGTAGYSYATSTQDFSLSPLITGLVTFMSSQFSTGLHLLWVGAVLYALGRLLERGFITIIGFEHTPPSQLIVKGPDEKNVVWIGKPYSNPVEAEMAAKSFSQRLGSWQE